ESAWPVGLSSVNTELAASVRSDADEVLGSGVGTGPAGGEGGHSCGLMQAADFPLDPLCTTALPLTNTKSDITAPDVATSSRPPHRAAVRQTHPHTSPTGRVLRPRP